MGIISGCGLAVAGVVMQSILKNPLADPYTTGVSAGALFGATVAITTQTSYTGGPYTIVMNAFIFSLVPTMVIAGVAKKRNASPTVMIMAGIAVMYIFNAMTTVMKLWSDPNSLADLYRWQVGSLTMATWDDLPIVFAVVIAGVVFTMLISKKLNVMSTGDESAKALGVNVETMRIACLIAVALMSAVIVSFTGLIGFVGLIAPHVARIFIGADNRYLIPASALFGATLMLASDLIGRTIIAPATLQVGVVTAFLGGPLFLWLIINRKNKVWG
jgi:iron complex transport system permease protein